jgi:hypothetical protein
MMTMILAILVFAPAFPGADRWSELEGVARREGWARMAIGDRIAHVGRALIGTPYLGGTLDISPEIGEVLRPNLAGLDCVTFAEQAWAIAVATEPQGISQTRFLDELTQIRYRGGRNFGYASRLHYFSDWMNDHVAQGRAIDVVKGSPDAIPFARQVGFMTRNADKYPALARPGMLDSMKEVESRLNATPRWWWAKPMTSDAAQRLESGDIVGFADVRAGLDCAHVGIIWREGETVRVLHASSLAKRVILDEEITALVNRNRAWSGLLAIRPVTTPKR